MSDGLSDDVSDWGSDFDEDAEEGTSSRHQPSMYEVPDGKPSIPIPTVVPEWLNKVADENLKPTNEYIEHILLPTRATKDEESKTFIETLKRKLSQKNLLAGVKNSDKKSPHTENNHNNATTNPYNAIVSANNNFNNSTENSKKVVEYGQKIKQIKECLQIHPWFYRVDRSKAELILENYTQDGSFLVRECHHGSAPLTLTLRFNKRLFHIQIRLRHDSTFALGTSKANEMHFNTVSELIDTYKKTNLQLHSNGKFFGQTTLTYPPIVSDV